MINMFKKQETFQRRNRSFGPQRKKQARNIRADLRSQMISHGSASVQTRLIPDTLFRVIKMLSKDEMFEPLDALSRRVTSSR